MFVALCSLSSQRPRSWPLPLCSLCRHHEHLPVVCLSSGSAAEPAPRFSRGTAPSLRHRFPASAATRLLCAKAAASPHFSPLLSDLAGEHPARPVRSVRPPPTIQLIAPWMPPQVSSPVASVPPPVRSGAPVAGSACPRLFLAAASLPRRCKSRVLPPLTAASASSEARQPRACVDRIVNPPERVDLQPRAKAQLLFARSAGLPLLPTGPWPMRLRSWPLPLCSLCHHHEHLPVVCLSCGSAAAPAPRFSRGTAPSLRHRFPASAATRLLCAKAVASPRVSPLLSDLAGEHPARPVRSVRPPPTIQLTAPWMPPQALSPVASVPPPVRSGDPVVGSACPRLFLAAVSLPRRCKSRVLPPLTAASALSEARQPLALTASSTRPSGSTSSRAPRPSSSSPDPPASLCFELGHGPW
nr:pollen-specific leucine-rich repeat extensin-like protein 2 [Aegilops tauschii subsp. strangulata]